MHETHARAIELVGHHLPEERRHSLAHRPGCRIAEEIEKVDERTCESLSRVEWEENHQIIEQGRERTRAVKDKGRKGQGQERTRAG